MTNNTNLFTKILKILLALVACNIILLFVFNRLDTGQSPRLYTVQSDSMRPAILTGDLILTFPVTEYHEGDVITFQDRDRDIVVTHRIAAIARNGATLTYTTKGDANEDIDTNPVLYGDIYGKVSLRLPYAGYVTAFARTVPGFVLIVIIPALLIIGHETKTIYTTIRQTRTQKEQI